MQVKMHFMYLHLEAQLCTTRGKGLQYLQNFLLRPHIVYSLNMREWPGKGRDDPKHKWRKWDFLQGLADFVDVIHRALAITWKSFIKLRGLMGWVSKEEMEGYLFLQSKNGVLGREIIQVEADWCSWSARGIVGLQVVPFGPSMRVIPTPARSFLIASDFSYSLFFLAAFLSSIFCTTCSFVIFARVNAFSFSCPRACVNQKKKKKTFSPLSASEEWGS